MTTNKILWAYLLVYSTDFGPQEDVQQMLDVHPHVLNWYRCLPNCFFFVSDWTASTIASSFRETYHRQGRFFVVDVSLDSNGWLPKRAWSFMRKPRRAGEDG